MSGGAGGRVVAFRLVPRMRLHHSRLGRGENTIRLAHDGEPAWRHPCVIALDLATGSRCHAGEAPRWAV